MERRRKTVAAPCISFFLIIVKSLQFRRRRQIAELRKYCFVYVIVFFGVCFLYFFFFVSHRLGIQVNSLHIVVLCSHTSSHDELIRSKS